LTLLLALLLAAEPSTSHQVSIPLADYEQLKKQTERPALTVVDLLRVEGSFAKRDLAVALSGRASGLWPTVEVLQAEGARLHSCEGEALLSRAESGGFAVTPLAQRFSLRCKLALDGSDRLEAEATAAVLEVVSAVQDGELVATSEGATRSFSVVRRFAGGEQPDLPPAVTGRYLVTLLPDETRFEYRLEVRNPARGHRRFEVALRAAEHVEGVDAKVAWDVEGTRYRFDLPPGETVLALRGRLSEARFVPPVEASLQYLLVQSHPLLRPDLTTGAKRVGVGETGLAAAFRGAQAFLLDGGGAEVSWTATKLQALKTAGIALSRLDQIFFLGTDGNASAESTLALDNQGAPSLTLPGAGYTFASIGGEPVFLTHDEAGNLFLPLGQGSQSLVVQAKHAFDRRLGFGLARLELPKVSVPASQAAIQLRYPAEWIPVYEELAPASRWHLLELTELATLLLLVALAERLLALAGLSARRRWLLAVSLAVAGAFLPALRVTAVAVLVLGWLGLGVALLVQRLRGAARVVALLAGAGAVLVVVIAWGAGVVGAKRAVAPELDSYGYSRLMKVKGEEAMPMAAPEPSEGDVLAMDGGTRARTDAGAVQGNASYEGLPAKIEIPPGARQTHFSRELLPLETPRRVTTLVVAAWFVSGLSTAAVLVFLGLAVLFRRALAAGAVVLVARVRSGAPAAPPLTTAT
jgi:hypothetical protein